MQNNNFLIMWQYFSIRSAKASLEKEMSKTIVESVHATADSIRASNEKEFKMIETLASLPEIKNPEISLLDKTHTIYGATYTDDDYIDVCILFRFLIQTTSFLTLFSALLTACRSVSSL